MTEDDRLHAKIESLCAYRGSAEFLLSVAAKFLRESKDPVFQHFSVQIEEFLSAAGESKGSAK